MKAGGEVQSSEWACSVELPVRRSSGGMAQAVGHGSLVSKGEVGAGDANQRTDSFIFIFYFYLLIFGGQGQRERNIDLLFPLSMHSLIDSCVCPNWR